MGSYLLMLVVSVAKLAALFWVALRATRFLFARLDRRGLFKRQPNPWLPVVSALVLLWVQVRGSTLGQAMAPLGVWVADYWRVDLASLYARSLAPSALLTELAGIAGELWHRPAEHAVAVGLLAAAAAGATLIAVAACRSPEAWRGLFLHVWLSLMLWLLLYHFLLLAYWTVHWLNFWIFFILLLFVQMWRKEDGSAKHSPS